MYQGDSEMDVVFIIYILHYLPSCLTDFTISETLYKRTDTDHHHRDITEGEESKSCLLRNYGVYFRQ